MDLDQLKEELRRRLSKRPLESFRVVMQNGERFEVTRTLQLGLGLTEFAYAPPGKGPFLRRPLRQIAAVESSDGASAPTPGSAEA